VIKQTSAFQDLYCLEIAATGVSAPPVVCVSGLTGAMGEWSEVREALDSRTSLVTYSRPALGTSDHLPAALAVKSHPPSWAAAQLQTLLDHAGVASPRILVGHSIGALIVEAYAARWPQEAAGMVLVDPAHPRGHLELFREPTPTDDERGGIRFDMHAGHNERLHFPRPRFPTAVISTRMCWCRFLDVPIVLAGGVAGCRVSDSVCGGVVTVRGGLAGWGYGGHGGVVGAGQW
jgi:pimeloyl-ACP methyl ester carboxylesterase